MFFFLTQEMMHASSLITNITAPCLLLQLFHTSSGKSGSIGKGAGFCGFVVCSLSASLSPAVGYCECRNEAPYCWELQLLKVLSLKPGIGQNITLHASPVARNYARLTNFHSHFSQLLRFCSSSSVIWYVSEKCIRPLLIWWIVLTM